MRTRVESAAARLRDYRTVAGALIRRLREDRRAIAADLHRYAARYADAPVQGPNEPTVVTDSLPNVVPVTFAVRRTSSEPPWVNVMIPGMALWAMSGGPNTALNLTLRLARAGLPIRYVSTDVPGESDHDRLWNHLHEVTGISERYDNVEFVDGHDRSVETLICEDDIFFGTAWWTVQMIKRALPMTRSRRFLYLIQDFEPGLYPWSTTYALALETYGLDFSAIVNESFLFEHLQETKAGRFADPSFCRRARVFEPAVDRRHFFPAKQSPSRSRRRLLFYARPSAPRNLYELGIVALKRAAERGAFEPDRWELFFMGDDLPPARLTTDVTVQPLPWLDFGSYAALLRESDVGLALMLSPHTGYPTLEMAACGVTVVTNTYATKTSERLASLSPNIVATAPTAESVTEGLIQAATTAAAEQPRGELTAPASWEEVFGLLVPDVLEMIDECRGV